MDTLLCGEEVPSGKDWRERAGDFRHFFDHWLNPNYPLHLRLYFRRHHKNQGWARQFRHKSELAVRSRRNHQHGQQPQMDVPLQRMARQEKGRNWQGILSQGLSSVFSRSFVCTRLVYYWMPYIRFCCITSLSQLICSNFFLSFNLICIAEYKQYISLVVPCTVVSLKLVHVTWFGNWWCHPFYTTKSDDLFSHRPTEYRHHSHPLRLSRCSCNSATKYLDCQ